MVKRTGPTNFYVKRAIRLMRKAAYEYKADLWRAVADEINVPARRRRGVNISRINRFVKEGETAIVPGKVLGAGVIKHPVYVAALSFSKQARSKITGAGGECISIEELIKRNPKGSYVKIIG